MLKVIIVVIKNSLKIVQVLSKLILQATLTKWALDIDLKCHSLSLRVPFCQLHLPLLENVN